ncbi:LytR/AlgR family response regulator transcription factor [Portibacter marinus]|uniref:LytR/AlgR family response regulator transcription factor n=1 Tax=Portibacter marinus TaxID=2898660 RepID=UPI001F19745E|nr:LytTR family DNA-binding domain-containing protein [Portibacter marinus]
MKKINAIIVDDEPLAHRIIERYAVDLPFLEIIGQFYFATEAYSILNDRPVDLIFLDIEMPKLKGLDFLKSLTERPQIILTTAYEEYALEGFNLQVADYLLKPFSFDRFLQAVQRVMKNIDMRSSLHDSGSDSHLFIKVDKRHVQVNIADVYYLESYGNYVKVWFKDEMLLTPSTLTAYEEALASKGFEKVHKSFLVNRHFVDYVEGNTIFMLNGKEVPVGKNHRGQVKAWFA